MVSHAPPSGKKPVIGCGGGLLVLMGIVICLWLTSLSGFGMALLLNRPLFVLPVPIPHSLTMPLAHQPQQTYQVIGKPSLEPAFINQVLMQAHSPAKGTGQILYNLSTQFGIDDAFALAFFEHESLFGTTGVARVTRSLGNIRCSAGYRCVEGYRAYPRWEDGYLDWYQLILYGYVQGSVTRPLVGHACTTLNQIIPVYAPSSDGNDVEGYIHAVEHAVSTWRSGKMEVTT